MLLFSPFYYFQAHTAIMVGALPEASLVIDGVERSVRMTAPEPFAVLVVNKLGFDIVPTALGFL